MWTKNCELTTHIIYIGKCLICHNRFHNNLVYYPFWHTVKPVYNDHSRDQVMVVFADKWSLYRGALVALRWSVEQPTVASIGRWSFYANGL